MYVGSLDSKDSKLVLNVASNVVYASGHLLYVREGALVAQEFDPERLTVKGEPVTLVPDVLMDERFSRGVFSASPGGGLVFQTGKGQTLSALRLADAVSPSAADGEDVTPSALGTFVGDVETILLGEVESWSQRVAAEEQSDSSA